MSFSHFAPELKIFAGEDVFSKLRKELERSKLERAVVFCGATVSALPEHRQLCEALAQRYAGTFSKVKARSPVSSVLAATDFLRETRADAIIVIGGGSASVTARAAAIFIAEGQNLDQIATHRDASGNMVSPRLSAPKLPIFTFPTTPTTAVAKVGTAIFCEKQHQRYALFDPKTRAKALFLHPKLLSSSPKSLALSAGLDALVVAVDGLMSLRGDAISDANLIHAVRLLSENLLALASKDSDVLRETLSMAAILSARGTDISGTGLTTVLSHAISTVTAADSGVIKAILLPHTLRFVGDYNVQGLDKILGALGASDLDAALSLLHEINQKLGLPQRLDDIGVPAEAFPVIAEHAMSDWFLKDSPRPITDPAPLVSLLRAVG